VPLLLRTVAVTLSPLLRDLVIEVLSPGFVIDVVEVLSTREGLDDRLSRIAPELVLTGLLDSETAAIAPRLLAGCPTTRLLLFARNGERAWFYQSGRGVELNPVTPQALRDALRSSDPSPMR
jgi:hypothetical protein